MPFCTKCGNQVGSSDLFCGRCGDRQQPAAAAGGFPHFSNLTPRTATLLCYLPIIGWIGSIIVLASPTFQHNREVRFHGFQGLYLFVVWLIVDWVVSPLLLPFGHFPGAFPLIAAKVMLKLAIFATWIFMLVKTSQREDYHLPVIGELAERSLSEQR